MRNHVYNGIGLGNYANGYNFFVKVKGRNTLEYQHEGKTYIEGRKGSSYSLFFRNDTSKRVLVVFSVDGLSVMDGKSANKDSDGYVVNAWGEIEVPGWRINQDKIAMFRFSPQGDKDKTYVEELASEGFDVDPSNQGVIGCMVFEEKERPVYSVSYYYPQPYYPPQHYQYFPRMWTDNILTSDDASISSVSGAISMNCSYSAGSGSGGYEGGASGNMNQIDAQSCFYGSGVEDTSLGTSFGKDKKFATTEINFEKNSYSSWTGVIYYDTITNLKKKGVIVERKEPEAFPGSNGCYVPRRRA